MTLSKLDEMLDVVQGGVDVLFMNKTLRRKVNALIRAAGQAQETVSDSFGRQIPAYASIPIGVLETDKDGDEILAFDEAAASGNSVTSSIYAVKFGAAEYVSGLQAGIMDIEDLGLNRTKFETLVEWVVGMAIFHPRAAGRLRYVKNA